MKTQILRSLVFIVTVGLMSQVTLGAKQEIVITNAGGDQQVPTVWKSIVVFENKQSGKWNTSFKDLSSSQSIIRTIPRLGENRNPSISGNTVVWQSKSSSTWNILAADISNQANPIVFSVDNYQTDLQHPKIWGTSVIYEFLWEGYWWLRLMDISDPVVPTHSQWFGGWAMTDLQRPAIWGDLLLSQYKEAGTWEIFAHSVHDPNLSAFVVAIDNDQTHPAIHGNWAVWQDDYNGDWDILGDNIGDPFYQQQPICDQLGSDSSYPAIWNNVVVWQDNRNGNWDIYAHNLTTKMEFQVTDNTRDQTKPTISFSEELNQYVVVWQDNRNGNWDIYGALLNGAEVAGCVSPLKWDINKDSIVDVYDIREIEDHVGERNGVSP